MLLPSQISEAARADSALIRLGGPQPFRAANGPLTAPLPAGFPVSVQAADFELYMGRKSQAPAALILDQ